MNFVEPSIEIWENNSSTIEEVYKDIERAARICYKSEDKITEDSYKKMIDNLISRKHYAMLEHGTIYLKVPDNARDIYGLIGTRYEHNMYSVTTMYDDFYYISTNYRVLIENKWLNDLQYLCAPTKYHEKRISIKFITTIGITRELIRHRVFSFANESTRYCNYSADKFNNEVTYIKPSWFDDSLLEVSAIEMRAALDICNAYYKTLIKNGLSPQLARDILPLRTKSEIIMTGFEFDWVDFLKKRADGETGKPHPDMEFLAKQIKKQWRIL